MAVELAHLDLRAELGVLHGHAALRDAPTGSQSPLPAGSLPPHLHAPCKDWGSGTPRSTHSVRSRGDVASRFRCSLTLMSPPATLSTSLRLMGICRSRTGVCRERGSTISRRGRPRRGGGRRALPPVAVPRPIQQLAVEGPALVARSLPAREAALGLESHSRRRRRTRLKPGLAVVARIAVRRRREFQGSRTLERLITSTRVPRVETIR